MSRLRGGRPPFSSVPRRVGDMATATSFALVKELRTVEH